MGELGDQINVILADKAYNRRQWIQLRLNFFNILKNLNFPISQHLMLTNLVETNFSVFNHQLFISILIYSNFLNFKIIKCIYHFIVH